MGNGAKKFILFDGRAKSGDTDDASVMDTADSEQEARRNGARFWSGADAVWFEHDFVNGEAINERIRPDIPPGNKPPGSGVA